MEELTILKEKSLKFDESTSTMSMLKFKNYDSYLYGETQLVYFVETRKYLRGRRSKNDSVMQLVFLSLSQDELSVKEKNLNDSKSVNVTKNNAKESQRNYEFPPIFTATKESSGAGSNPSQEAPQCCVGIVEFAF